MGRKEKKNQNGEETKEEEGKEVMTEIEDEEYISKILGGFQLTLNQLLKPLRLYGQSDYVDMVTREITHLAWQLHWRLEGVDEPYQIEDIHW